MPRLKLTQTKQVASVRITAADRSYIEAKYSNLSEAIRLLTKGGKYEQQAEQIELLTAKLKEIKG